MDRPQRDRTHRRAGLGQWPGRPGLRKATRGRPRAVAASPTAGVGRVCRADLAAGTCPSGAATGVGRRSIHRAGREKIACWRVVLGPLTRPRSILAPPAGARDVPRGTPRRPSSGLDPTPPARKHVPDDRESARCRDPGQGHSREVQLLPAGCRGHPAARRPQRRPIATNPRGCTGDDPLFRRARRARRRPRRRRRATRRRPPPRRRHRRRSSARCPARSPSPTRRAASARPRPR